MLGYALEVFGLFGRKTHRAVGLVGFAIDGREDHVGREVAARQRGVKTILRIEHAVGTFGTHAAPRHTHGGIVFAPKPRSYSYVLNKKVKRLAMKSALSAKAAAGEIIVIDGIKMDSIKTKDFRAFLNAVKADGKSLVVTPAKDEIVVKSARNIPGVETSMANLINVYDILKAKYLVLDKEALTVIEEVFA